MKITDYSPVSKPGASAKKKGVSSSSDGGFFGLLSTSETESSTAPSPAADVQTLSSMDALLSLQEIPDNETTKQRAMEEGRGALETLEKLRLSLLSGTVSGNMLSKLGDISNLKKQAINDANLTSIINDIELRAAVELAKLERAAKE